MASVRSYLISALDSDKRYPGVGWMPLVDQGNDEFVLDLSPEELSVAINGLGVTNGDNLEWHVVAEDGLGNISQSVVTWLYQLTTVEEPSDEIEEVDDVRIRPTGFIENLGQHP